MDAWKISNMDFALQTELHDRMKLESNY
jgi:hypothetical protein